MRLTPEQIHISRDKAREAFGAESSVRLFGSRVSNENRGGDIDRLAKCVVLTSVWTGAA